MKFYLFMLFVLCLCSCSNKPNVVDYTPRQDGDKRHKVFIINHGWHTGFVFSAKTINQKLPFLVSRFGEPSYYEFGWGDKGFYQANTVTAGLAIQAILWPTESVMHVVAVQRSPLDYFFGSEIIELQLTDSQLDSLCLFIGNSFFLDENGNAKILSKGLYGNSQFYQGEGDYYLFNTCNKWTAKGLLSAGFDISPFFKLFADGIMSYLKDNCDSRAINCSVVSTQLAK
jgi:uncharacterized protein (TIGR02117 family)